MLLLLPLLLEGLSSPGAAAVGGFEAGLWLTGDRSELGGKGELVVGGVGEPGALPLLMLSWPPSIFGWQAGHLETKRLIKERKN